MTQSANRLEIASRYVNIATELPGFEAMVLSGSEALGVSDSKSDLDLVGFYSRLPVEEICDALQGAGESLKLTVDAGTRFWWKCTTEGVDVDIGFIAVSTMEDVFRDVLDQSRPTPLWKQVSIRGIQECKTLAGEELVFRWKTRCSDYPRSLRIAATESHLPLQSLGYSARDLTRRGGSLYATQVLVETIEKLFGIWLALNEQFHPGDLKRWDVVLKKMRLVPEELQHRLENIVCAPLERSLVELKQIASSTLDLVERELPEVDVTETRKFFSANVS